MKKNQNGNILFLILIAVALFSALSYAITGSSRTSGATIEKEKQKLAQGELDSYTASLNRGRMYLEIIAKCDSIDYTPPSDWGNGDKSCHLFHPDGGNVVWRDVGLDSCELTNIDPTTLNVGEACGSMVYAGVVGGKRIYAAIADTGPETGNNASTNYTVTGATSTTDGLANTNTLLATSDAGSPYPAAILCRSYGANMYLPSKDELDRLYQVKDIGAFNGTFTGYIYWSSTENGSPSFAVQGFDDGTQYSGYKYRSYDVRCVRRYE